MQPKKKGMETPIVYGIFLILVLFIALHGAVAYKIAQSMVAVGELEKTKTTLTVINLLCDRIATHPTEIIINEYTKQWLLWGGFGWLIVVLMLESNHKNFIQGKEFGTAKWGTLSDIKDLFASTIEASEIKKAKATRTKLGRWKARSNSYKKCEKDGNVILQTKLQDLKEEEEARKANGTANKKLYEERRKEIKQEVKALVESAKKEAWLPDRLEADYKSRIAEIEESPIFSEADKKKQKAKAKAEYEKKLSDFYNYSKRVASIKEKYKDADMLFTQTEHISFYNYILNQNTVILGGSGSGKTRGFVMPNVLQAHSSYVITDPKGEILEKAGYFLSEIKGYKIRVLNLDEKTQSDGYNPFVYIHPERDGYEERVLSLIETIIINTDGGEKKGGSDPFWDKAERLFLQAVFFFTTDGFVAEERNMNTVLALIGMLQIAEEEDDFNSDLDIFARIFAERYGADHIGVQQYREFREKASGKTAKSIVISAVARLAPFRTKAVRRIFSYDTMNLDRVGEEKTAIFVVVPPTDTTFNFIAGMLFTQLFQELQYCATQVHKHDGQRLPVPCRFILDEFANTCTIPNFVKILAYARSFGIGITPILQSLEQIKNMYKDEWGVIVDNCNTLLYLGSITHMDTLEYMSKLLGKGTFDKKTTGRTRGRSGSSSQNFDVIGRELMDSAEIRKLPKKNCLFIVGGRNPFYSEKYNYESHPNYRFTSDANKKFSYHYVPEQPQEEAKVPHGEEVAVNPSVEAQDATTNIRKVEVDLDPSKQIARLSQGIKEVQPISDELMTVEDGESTEKVEELTLEALLEQKQAEKEKARISVSEEAKLTLEKAKAERIEIEESIINAINRIGRTYRNMEVISDELMTVEDGEQEAVVETVEEKVAEILMEEESLDMVELKDVEDSLADINGILAGMVGFDENPEIDS